ncbi:MAG: nitroreductase family protein [Candidatus Hodarchaeota archaeon]
MEFLEVIKTRRSIRKYLETPVPDESLQRILDVGRIAPSAANKQPWHFILIKDKTQQLKIKPAYDREWLQNAPVILIVCVDINKGWTRADGREYSTVDAAITMHSMILAAANEGLGTCWIANFKELELKKVLNIPENITPIAMTPIGYPDSEEKLRPFERKTLKEILHEENW